MGTDTHTVTGITCSHCVVAMREAVGQILGVQGVEASRRLTISSDAVGDRSRVKDAVEEAGYALAEGVDDDGVISDVMPEGKVAVVNLTLVPGGLRVAADAIRLSWRTLGTISGNLFWTFAYNEAAIPLAVAGPLNPMVAGATMRFSPPFGASDSLRLRGFKAVADERAHTLVPDTASHTAPGPDHAVAA
jgi:P-type Cu+ transporter